MKSSAARHDFLTILIAAIIVAIAMLPTLLRFGFTGHMITAYIGIVAMLIFGFLASRQPEAK